MAAFDLTVVHAAARAGGVSIGGPKYREKLLPYLHEFVKMIEFTEAVLLELTAQDFMSTQEYAGIKHDEYGVAISSALQKRFDIEGLETWYVKFTVDLDDDGSQVLVVSLHEPAHKLKRVGGVLPIRFARSQS